MRHLIRIITILGLSLLPFMAQAAGNESCLRKEVDIDVGNKASLQRGAKWFANYCMSCHSAGYQRYSQLARDLDLTDRQVSEHLVFTTDVNGAPTKLGEHMKVPMTDAYAKEAFGTVPPNLSLTARVRGAQWLYNYLQGFYLDESRTTGVNNICFKDVGMPHVLWELQGWQVPKYDTRMKNGKEERYISDLIAVVDDPQLAEEYDKISKDLVTFMVYLSEPAQLERKRLGIWVLLFMFVFFLVAYYLKKEYWRDVS